MNKVYILIITLIFSGCHEYTPMKYPKDANVIILNNANKIVTNLIETTLILALKDTNLSLLKENRDFTGCEYLGFKYTETSYQNNIYINKYKKNTHNCSELSLRDDLLKGSTDSTFFIRENLGNK